MTQRTDCTVTVLNAIAAWKIISWGWRDSLAVKCVCCSCRGVQFPPPTVRGSQLHISPVPGHPMPPLQVFGFFFFFVLNLSLANPFLTFVGMHTKVNSHTVIYTHMQIKKIILVYSYVTLNIFREHGKVGKVLATQPWRPEFDLQHVHESNGHCDMHVWSLCWGGRDQQVLEAC